MPEIPQIVAPTLTPRPEMNPRIAGEPGAAMANAAEQMGSVAEQGYHFAEKLQKAQETVDVKMGEVGIDKLEADAHAAMGKATTPEQMQDIQRGFEEQAKEAIKSQKNPKVSRALQFYGAHKSIGIQDLATVRQAKVITGNDLTANEMLGTKYSGDYVLAAASGGDTTMAENDERILLASSVRHGTMTQEQADAHYDKWLKSSKMDTIGALANSPKPEDRQRVIKMLRGSDDASKNFTEGNESLHPVLQQVLKEYPGLAKNFNSKNTSLVFAGGERQQRGSKERGGLEFWPPEGEPVATGGDATYPTPELGKNVLEVYSDDLKNNPEELKLAIQGDLLHGMTKDPYWKNLRDQFMKNFTPEEIKRQNEAETWWEDVNGDRHAEQKGEVGHSRGNGAYDAYIRGWLFNEGDGRQGQVEQGSTMYSPKQIEILQEMDNYLKTGKSIEESTRSMSDHPLVDGMNLAERNTTLTAAEHKDHELTEMAEATDLNSVLNNMHDAFGKFPYTNNGKGDYEARENALDDGDFLKSIGAVSPDGKPDRVMGGKLQQEVTRQRAEWEKEAADKDQGIISKYVPNVMKMSESQVTALGKEGLSPRGISALEMERKRQIAEIRSSNLQERALTRQKAAEDSYELVARLGSQPGYLTKNDIPDLMKSNPKMKYSDALHVVEMRSAQSDPNFQSAMKIFEDAANQGAMTLSDVGEANIAMLKRAKEGVTGTDLMKFASETVRPHVEKDIKNRLDQIVYPQFATPTAAPGTAQPGFFSRLGTWAENQVVTNAFPKTLKANADQESAARQAPTSRKEYFDGMKRANPGASDAAINKYLDDKGIK